MNSLDGAQYIVKTSTVILWSDIPKASGVTALVVLHLISLGYWGAKLAGYRAPGFWAGTAVRAGIGFTLLGAEMLLLGYLHTLSASCLLLSSGIMVLALIPILDKCPAWWSVAKREAGSLFHDDRIIASACVLVLLMVAVAGLRPPREVDEREYHWAAPLMWADHGRWVGTPFHNTNGPALGEIIYTFCAVFSVPTSAHWTSLLFLLTLLAGCCALTVGIGGRKIAALAACLSAPVIVNQACISYTDVAAAALVVAAYAALLCKNDEPASSSPMRGRIVAASLLLMGAISVKSNTLAALPAAAVFVFWTSLAEWKKPAGNKLLIVGRPALLCIPVFATFFLWYLHTYALTGDWKSRQKEIESMTVHSSSEEKWHTGEAVARVPSMKDLATLPFLPAITPVLGQKEPFGGRTGLLLYFAPIGLFGLSYLTPEQRRSALWLLGAAVAYYLSLGAIALKTRYHIFAWVVGACFASMAYDLIRKAELPLRRQIGLGTYYVFMFAGIGDIAHVVLRGLPGFR